MSVQNQNIVRLAKRESWTGEHPFARMHVDALQLAMNNLKGESLKLWLYCNKNQDNYQFELSQKAVAEWGLKKDAYQAAKKVLREKGYLVPLREDSNILVFYEIPLSEKQIQSEKPTEQKKGQSEKPTIESEKPITLSEKPTTLSEIPYRNTTNTTYTTNNTTAATTSFGGEQERKEIVIIGGYEFE